MLIPPRSTLTLHADFSSIGWIESRANTSCQDFFFFTQAILCYCHLSAENKQLSLSRSWNGKILKLECSKRSPQRRNDFSMKWFAARFNPSQKKVWNRYHALFIYLTSWKTHKKKNVQGGPTNYKWVSLNRESSHLSSFS